MPPSIELDKNGNTRSYQWSPGLQYGGPVSIMAPYNRPEISRFVYVIFSNGNMKSSEGLYLTDNIVEKVYKYNPKIELR